MQRRLGQYELDTETGVLTLGTTRIRLAPKSTALLVALAGRLGEVVTKEMLLDELWPEGDATDQNLLQHVYLIRKALAADASLRLETIPRVGYRLQAIAPEAAPAPKPVSPWRSWRLPAAIGAVVVTLAVASPFPERGHPVAALSAFERELAIARSRIQSRTPEALNEAERTLRGASALRPDDARPPAGLAKIEAIRTADGFGRHERLVMAYADAALQRDPHNAEALASRGLVEASAARDLDAADRDLRAAIASDPGDADARSWYGIALMARGEVNRAVTQFEAAVNARPSSHLTLLWLGIAYYSAERFRDAQLALRQSMEVHDDAETRIMLVMALGADGREREALAEAAPLLPRRAEGTLATVALVAARAGDRAMAEHFLRQKVKDRDPSPYSTLYRDLARGDVAHVRETLAAIDVKRVDLLMWAILRNDPFLRPYWPGTKFSAVT